METMKIGQIPDFLSEAVKLGILNISALSLFHLYQSIEKNK